MLTRRGLAALFALLALLFGFSGVAAAAPEKPDDTTATSCTARPITDEEVSAEYVRTVDGSSEFSAYEAVEFGFGLALQEGHCEGDSITFTPPQELGSNGSPVDLTTDGGVVIAHAVFSDGKVSVVLTDAVENTKHYAYEGHAWWRVSMKDVLVPGETRDLLWEIGGKVRRTPIQVAQCPGCSQPESWGSKWGYIPQDNPSKAIVTVATPVATADGQEFLIRDVLTSPGQEFACTTPAGQAGVYSTAGVWGQPQYTRYVPVTVVECTSTVVTVKIQLNAGEKARFELSLSVNPGDPGPWTDSAVITSQDRSWDASATVRRPEAGGGASYLLKPPPTPAPSPTPSVTPSPAPSPSPESTPTATPTPEPTPTPSATPSPSTTPSPEPTPTPTPSTTATPTPSVTPTPTPSVPSATTSPSPTRGQEVVTPPNQPPHKRPGGGLAHTGIDGDLLIKLSTGLIIVGLGFGGFVEARRRHSSREE